MSESTKSKGNEVISATLIELMLILVFVMLIVIVFTDQATKQHSASFERLCPQLKLALMNMNYLSEAESINCSLSEEDEAGAIKTWLKILEGVKKPTTGYDGDDSIVKQYENLKKENALLQQKLGKVKGDHLKDLKRIKSLEQTVRDLKILLGDKTALLEELASLRQEIDRLELQVKDLKAALRDAKAENSRLNSDAEKGAGSEPGACMGSTRTDGSISPDYLFKIDYTGAMPLITLRADGRHEEEISALVARELIPGKLLGENAYKVRFSVEEFRIAFNPILEYSKLRSPVCRYQALLYLEGSESTVISNKKEAVILEKLHVDKGLR